MNKKVRALAWIYIVMCGLYLVVGTFLCIGLLFSRDSRSGQALLVLGSGFVAFAAIYFIPGLLAGLALLRGKSWARTVIVVLSVLVILLFPVGTALGGFGLWVLLGKEGRQFAATAEPMQHPLRTTPSVSPAEASRYAGLLVAMAGVAALFVIAIGTGFRVTHTPAPPAIDGLSWGSFVVLALVVFVAVRYKWLRGPNAFPPPRTGRYYGGDRSDMEERRAQMEEDRRQRLIGLAADPVRRKYVERIERGEHWSDAQIDYAEDPSRLATCAHLQSVERAMRDAGIPVRLEYGSRITARCCVDHLALGARFSLPSFVHYSEPTTGGRTYEDAPSAIVSCDEHKSIIDVVHPLVATPETPWFPPGSEGRRPPVSSPDANTNVLLHIRTRIGELARIIEAPDHRLPSLGFSDGSGRPHIEVDGPTFQYVLADCGQEFRRETTTSLDDLLYFVFRDVTFSVAATHESRQQIGGQDLRRRIFPYQLGLLRLLDESWASRCAVEHETTLASYPFVDRPG